MTDDHKSAPWWWSRDDERFQGPYSTRDGAFNEARDNTYGDGFYICQATQGEPLNLSDSFDAKLFIENANDDAYAFSDPGGDAIFNLSTEQAADLQAAVRAAIDAWQERRELVFMPWAFAWRGKGEWIEGDAE